MVTSASTSTSGMTSNRPEMKRELIPASKLLEEPQDIALDLASSQIFISDFGANAKILVANLDGSGLKTLVESKILWPSSLAIDYPNSRLYWTDLKVRSLDSVQLDGQKRRLIRKFHPKEGKPNKIDVFESSVYFSTYQHNRLMKMDKFGLDQNISVIADDVIRITDLVIMHETKWSTKWKPTKTVSIMYTSDLQESPQE